MKKMLLVVFFVISCPKPSIKKILEYDYLQKAEEYYQIAPLYAYTILKNKVTRPEHTKERVRLLVRIYLDQREYERAAQILDSINWAVELDPHQTEIILLKTEKWDRLSEMTENNLLKGIAYFHGANYEKAIEYLSMPALPHDYRMLYLAQTYSKINEFERALSTLSDIDPLSPYLFQEYQNLLFDLLFDLEELTLVQNEIMKLKDPSLKECVQLRIYKEENDTKNLKKTAWRLIMNYPESAGAFHSLQIVKPQTKSEHKLFGKVYYYHANYDSAIKYLKKAPTDNEVNYFLGRIYYKRGNYSKALKHLAQSSWAAAYYYRGRVYEILEELRRAIIVYDSLGLFYKDTHYATRGSKRKAFLWEDLGDTLKAVETFLKIDERNTKFRAAIQLYKMGKFEDAEKILNSSSAPEFVYWKARVKEELGKPAAGLKNYLLETHPLSYYSLVQIDVELAFDTITVEAWIKQWGDSAASFTQNDSLHIENAVRYFELNAVNFAIKELKMIDSVNPHNLLYLSRLCAYYGADAQSIIYGLKIKKLAGKEHRKKMPVDFFKLLYPVRYIFTIIEQQSELDLCLAMIWQESLFEPGALSSANATGLMQIIPETAKEIARDLGIVSYSVNDPPTSIKFGWYYFSKLFGKFHSIPLSLAGYNAGPHRVKRWLESNPDAEIDEFIELIPYNETRNYVKSVLARQVIYNTLLTK